MSAVGLFKTFWDTRSDGVWQIAGMKGLDLKPAGQSEADHFAIEDSIVVLQGQPMIGEVNTLLGESIVPVVAADPLRVFGLDLKLNSDLAVCKVQKRSDHRPHQPLTIIQAGIRGVGMGVGSDAIAVGYAGMAEEVIFNEQNEIVSEPKFHLYVSKGAITEKYPDNFTEKTVSTPGPCFRFSAKIPGGMSGSPIFDREGVYVHGVVSKGLVDESGVARDSFGSMIAPSMGLPIRQMNGATLKALQEAHNEGMPILRGGGF